MKIKNLIIIVVSLLLVQLVYGENQRVFQLTLNYNKEEITKESLFVKDGYFTPLTEEGDYRLDVISFDNQTLYSQKFDFPLEVFGEPRKEWFDEYGNQIYIPTAEESGHQLLDQGIAELIFPYFDDAKLINIYDKDSNLKLSIDVSHFTRPNIYKKTPNKGILYIIIGIAIISVTLFFVCKKKFSSRIRKP